MAKRLTPTLALLLAVVLAFTGITMAKPVFAEGPEGIAALNVDIDISADTATIQSGQTGVYNLTFKTTGSMTEFSNAQIIVNVPQNVQFAQPLSELVIAGTQPLYDSATSTLAYSFPALATGQAYTTKIKIVPPNGTTAHGAVLTAQATFLAADIAPAVDSASITVTATAAPSISKRYSSTIGKTNDEPPAQGDIGNWELEVAVPKAQFGQLYLQEGSMITITDSLPAGTSFISANDGGSYDSATNTVTWTLPVPTIADQQASTDALFVGNYTIEMQFDEDLPDFSVITNTASVSITTIDGQTPMQSADASIQIASGNSLYDAPEGDWIYPRHWLNASLDTPTVYDWERLVFQTQYYIHQTYDLGDTTITDQAVLDLGYQEVTQQYNIDPNLNLYSLATFLPWYEPTTGSPAAPLQPLPETTISAKVSGAWQDPFTVDFSYISHVAGVQQPLYIALSSLGVDAGERVEALAITYYDVSGGLAVNPALYMHCAITPGFVGTVTNTVEEYGIFVDGSPFVVTESPVLQPRSANVVSQDGLTAVVSNQVYFDNADGNLVGTGNNVVQGIFSNTGSSQKRMAGPFSDMVLLPNGVTVDEENIGAVFKNGIGSYSPSHGSLEVLTDDYEDTSRQLVKITWTAENLNPFQTLGFRFNVIVSADSPSPLPIESYGFSGESGMAASSAATMIEVDVDDLNEDGNSTEPCAYTDTSYVLDYLVGLTTQKSVKGDLDNDFSCFGHVSPGGTITYNLAITNAYTDVISNMSLLDVLPSVGDLGITDNVERGSMWTPELTGPIMLPAEWQGKVNVYYSTATNPKRAGDLDQYTRYPATTTHLVDPTDAQEPNWVEASGVASWSDIHSYKIELAPGVTWTKGASMNLQFTMTAPTTYDPGLVDPAVDERERAAWNSFAFAVNSSQAVEPERVGVVMNTLPPVVTKTVNDAESVSLAARDDVFHFDIAYDFGTGTGTWETAMLVDDLALLPAQDGVNVQDVLEFLPDSVTITDENGDSVIAEGSLEATENRVSFEIAPQGESYQFLSGQTYTLGMDARIKSTATDDELEAFMSTLGGIPNAGYLQFEDGGVQHAASSNEVVVVPPTPQMASASTVSESSQSIPVTGDQLAAILLVALLIVAAGIIGAVAYTRKRKTMNSHPGSKLKR